jgi:hypothetical protein
MQKMAELPKDLPSFNLAIFLLKVLVLVIAGQQQEKSLIWSQ